MGRERVGRVGRGWGADNTVAVRRGRLVCDSETHGGWSAKRDVYEGSGEEGNTKGMRQGRGKCGSGRERLIGCCRVSDRCALFATALQSGPINAFRNFITRHNCINYNSEFLYTHTVVCGKTVVSLVPRTAQCSLHCVDGSNQGTAYFQVMCASE